MKLTRSSYRLPLAALIINASFVVCIKMSISECYKEVWQLRKLRAMGINGLSIGVESGDNETLALANFCYKLTSK